MHTVSEYQRARIMVICGRGKRIKLRRWIGERSMEMKIEFERLEGIGDPL
jgi:hypothetical protein